MTLIMTRKKYFAFKLSLVYSLIVCTRDHDNDVVHVAWMKYGWNTTQALYTKWLLGWLWEGVGGVKSLLSLQKIQQSNENQYVLWTHEHMVTTNKAGLPELSNTVYRPSENTLYVYIQENPEIEIFYNGEHKIQLQWQSTIQMSMSYKGELFVRRGTNSRE